MIRTIRALIHICLFRAGPQDLPASGQLLIFTMVSAFILLMARIAPLSGASGPFLISLTQIGLLALGLRILLSVFSRRERWLQSASAMFGCSSILMLAVAPIRMITESLLAGAGNPVLVIMNIWNFAVIVFILRETLGIRWLLAFLITFALELLSALVLWQMLGGQVT